MASPAIGSHSARQKESGPCAQIGHGAVLSFAGNALDVGVHAVGAGPLHLVGNMAVNVQGEGGGGVALPWTVLISSPERMAATA